MFRISYFVFFIFQLNNLAGVQLRKSRVRFRRVPSASNIDTLDACQQNSGIPRPSSTAHKHSQQKFHTTQFPLLPSFFYFLLPFLPSYFVVCVSVKPAGVALDAVLSA